MSREKLLEPYRDQVIEEEMPLLKKVENYLVKSGSINFDDVFKNPDVVLDTFRKENIISDLKVREGKEVGKLDENANGLVVFSRVNSNSSEIFGNLCYLKVIVSSKDKEDAKKIISETLSDCDVPTKYKEFFSEENKLQLVFSESHLGMFFPRMFSSCGEDQ